jgi:hypothetical protein
MQILFVYLVADVQLNFIKRKRKIIVVRASCPRPIYKLNTQHLTMSYQFFMKMHIISLRRQATLREAASRLCLFSPTLLG